MAVELLSSPRVKDFCSFVLTLDVQIQVNRREALRKLVSCMATDKDPDDEIFEWGADSFDKLQTFLAQNDAQVHYQGSTSVGVYAFIKLMASLRRALRDESQDSSPVSPQGVLRSPVRGPSASGVSRPVARSLLLRPETSTPQGAPREYPISTDPPRDVPEAAAEAS